MAVQTCCCCLLVFLTQPFPIYKLYVFFGIYLVAPVPVSIFFRNFIFFACVRFFLNEYHYFVNFRLITSHARESLFKFSHAPEFFLKLELELKLVLILKILSSLFLFLYVHFSAASFDVTAPVFYLSNFGLFVSD